MGGDRAVYTAECGSYACGNVNYSEGERAPGTGPGRGHVHYARGQDSGSASGDASTLRRIYLSSHYRMCGDGAEGSGKVYRRAERMVSHYGCSRVGSVVQAGDGSLVTSLWLPHEDYVGISRLTRKATMTKSEWLFPPEFGLVGKRRRYHGGGDSPPPQQATTTTSQTYSPEETAARNALWGAAAKVYSNNTTPPPAPLPTSSPAAPATDPAATAWRQSQIKANPGGFNDTGLDGKQFFNSTGADPTPAGGGPTAPAASSGTQPLTLPYAAPVPFSPDTTAAQNNLRSVATTQGPQVAQQAQQALQFGLHDVLNPTASPGFQASLDTATRRVGQAYTDPNGVLSQIRTGAMSGNSTGSGTREGVANGIAARSYLNTIGDVTGKMTSDAYASGLDTFNKTLAFAPNAYNLMTQPAITQAAVGQQNEAQSQAQADYEAANKNYQQNAPWQQLGNYANIIYGGSNPTTTTSGTAPGPTRNPAAPLGMALQGAALGSMIMPGIGTGVGAGAGLLLGML